MPARSSFVVALAASLLATTDGFCGPAANFPGRALRGQAPGATLSPFPCPRHSLTRLPAAECLLISRRVAVPCARPRTCRLQLSGLRRTPTWELGAGVCGCTHPWTGE